MDSPQSVVSPFKGSYAFEKQNNHLFVENAGCLSRENGVQRNEIASNNLDETLGVLDIFIHEARDIHNICIYHKQDVFAKLCLTSDPDHTLLTKTVKAGGKNPVFNESLRLKVRTIDSSLKCEIWMLSINKSYLEDQLLGFALVPLSEVILGNGKLDKEFSLSSTDLFHSPAGFVQLSLAYNGALPEVIAIPSPSDAFMAEAPESGQYEYHKIEFPDPNIVNENHQMISEYFEIPCTDMDSSQCCSSTENPLSSEMGVQFLESFSTCTINSTEYPKLDSPPSSVSTNGSSSASLPVSTQSSDSSKSSNEEYASRLGDAESHLSIVKPLVSVNIEQDQKMVQQDIVDMYMKSMQQFTDSLAKMKLPLEIDNGPTSSGNSTSDQKSQISQTKETVKNPGSRVFYGSRAFF